MKISGYGWRKQISPVLTVVMTCLSTACATGGPTQGDALPELKAENFLTLPLREGTAGFDRLDRALQDHFGSIGGASATSRIDAQKPATLRDGVVIQRYLRPDDSRHMLVELSSEPCFSIKQAIAIARPDPSKMDYYQSTGLYTATGQGMSVGFSSDGFKRECVKSLEIAEMPR
ncbi:MAG: hypothetical protein ACREP7_16030 [Lysobacter sp.]